MKKKNHKVITAGDHFQRESIPGRVAEKGGMCDRTVFSHSQAGSCETAQSCDFWSRALSSVRRKRTACNH